MRVALIGYGKMGKEIEKILLERQHHVTQKLNRKPQPKDLEEIDVAIEFSKPETAYENLKSLLQNKVPTVCGTTAWLKDYKKVVELTQHNQTAFLYASNFSLGVNLFFALNQQLAKLMRNHKEYKVQIEEIHHTQKIDAPSGTAVSLAEQIIQNTDYDSWSLAQNATESNQIPIHAKRIDPAPGTHKISYGSTIDQINIEHVAHSRKGFAFGAVLAAEWIQNKKGVFGMEDVLAL